MDVDQRRLLKSFRAALSPTPPTIIQTLQSSIHYLPELPSTPLALLQSYPVIELEESDLMENRLSMHNTLIGQCLHRIVPTKILAQRLPTVWQIQGSLEVLELPNGFLLFKSSTEVDLSRAREGSQWAVADEPIAVTSWVQNFNPNRAYFGTAPLWIRLPGSLSNTGVNQFSERSQPPRERLSAWIPSHKAWDGWGRER